MKLKSYELAPGARQKERSSLSSILLRPTLKSSGIIDKRRNIHTGEGGTRGAGKDLKIANEIYMNRYREQILFLPCYQPLGYEFVPSGNIFITRNCRSLAQHVYAVYRSKNRNRCAAQIGLYVPKEVYKKVQAEFDIRRLQNDQSLWQSLVKHFPKMPYTDRREIRRLIFAGKPQTLERSISLETAVFQYVQDRYTHFKSLDRNWEKYREEADWTLCRAKEILASWRE